MDDFYKKVVCILFRKDIYIEDQASLIMELNKEEVNKALTIPVVMDWVVLVKELPPVNTYVLLYNIKDKKQNIEFINEYELTTEKYTRNWTHWTIVKPPCA